MSQAELCERHAKKCLQAAGQSEDPDDALVDALSEALINVWQRLGLPLKHQALAT